MTATRPAGDREVRRLIEEALDETLVIEAAAGTGKTTELVKRMVRVVASGLAGVTEMVAVTFTEKAAGELKLRLRQELELERTRTAVRGDEDVCRLVEDALSHLEEAHVSTIHGFCADLLRDRPVEARVDPLFSVLTEGQASRMYDEAFDGWFQEALVDPPEGVRRSLRRTSRSPAADEDGPIERLRRAGRDLLEWRDFTAGWQRPEYAREREVEALAAQVHAFVDLRARPSSGRDPLFTDTDAAARTSDGLRVLEASGLSDHDGAEALLVDLARDYEFRQKVRKGTGAAFGPGLPRESVYEAYRQLLAALQAFAADADADLAALLREELRSSIDRYEALKRRAGALDFLDLLLRARDLVRDNDDVRRDFQQRFKRIFVDEFQDTDPLQAEILLLLASRDPLERDWRRVEAAPGRLFVVGDPKQSIYRFRRADVEIYRQVCRQLRAGGALYGELSTSFRSVPQIQRVINAAFGPLMTGDEHTQQSGYVPLAPDRPDALQPAVVALPVPRPYGKKRVAAASIDVSLPDAVGAFVAWLVRESGWTVTERRTREMRVPVAARHICILFRKMVKYDKDLTRPYLDALEARGVHHLLVGGRTFHEREEIETLRAALAAIEWPDDELSVFATLRGALFAIGDEELLEYRYRHGQGFHPFHIPHDLPSHLQPVGEALTLIAELHRSRNRRPVAETIGRLLAATRAHLGFALRQAGAQVLANVLHVSELARQFEMSGGMSFRGFVEELRIAADAGRSAEAPVLEEGSDGVRLMTVHKAKGLEFPVVILADMTVKLSASEADRHLDAAHGLCAVRIGGWSPRELLLQQPIEQERDRQEGIRVAYVASTRARDLLVVPVVGDEAYPADGWFSPLNAAIYPDVSARRQADAAPACPPFRKDSVVFRPDDEPARPTTVCPGLHRIRPSSPEGPLHDFCPEVREVVWWDPHALHLDVEVPLGLQRQELIVKDVPEEIVLSGKARYEAWRDQRGAAIAAGERPSLRVRTVTEWAASATAGPKGPALRTDDIEPRRASPFGPAGIVEVDVVSLEESPAGRPSGPRYGRLVHATLAAVPLDADASVLRLIAATQARILGSTEEETASAIEVVHHALAHPLFDRARAADRQGRCRREAPLTVMMEGTLVEGVADFAFEAADGYTVIDFKTDRDIESTLDHYRWQVAVYAAAISQATGKPARALVFRV